MTGRENSMFVPFAPTHAASSEITFIITALIGTTTERNAKSSITKFQAITTTAASWPSSSAIA